MGRRQAFGEHSMKVGEGEGGGSEEVRSDEGGGEGVCIRRPRHTK